MNICVAVGTPFAPPALWVEAGGGAEVATTASVGVSGGGVVVTMITVVGCSAVSLVPGADNRREPIAYKPRQNTPEQPKPSTTPIINHCQLLSRVRPRNELIIRRSPLAFYLAQVHSDQADRYDNTVTTVAYQ